MSIQQISEISSLILKRDSDLATTPQCSSESSYNGSTNLRILSVFMILLSSSLGAFFPLLSSRYSFIRLPDFCWFFAKFFGSGVIIATGFMHLLEPASKSLSNDCLGDGWTGYPWAFAICLISLFVLFFTEIVTHHFVAKATGSFDDDAEEIEMHTHSHFGNHTDHQTGHRKDITEQVSDGSSSSKASFSEDLERQLISKDSSPCVHPSQPSTLIPGANHFSHDASHETLSVKASAKKSREKYLNQMLSVFILEFGVIFHSIFVGLSLAVSGEEFKTLFVVLVFHQMFEGLGLGTRIAETPWDSKSHYTPWILALGFSISTPIAIAIGMGVRQSFIPGSRSALVSNGIFDSISAGILIYTGIVELMAHEFIYSNQFKSKDGLKKMIAAYILMCFGAGMMALLAKWA